MIAKLVAAISEARKQIPYDLEQFRFFGHDDVWVYHAVFDEKLCILTPESPDISPRRIKMRRKLAKVKA
jgi:hypothetical protein